MGILVMIAVSQWFQRNYRWHMWRKTGVILAISTIWLSGCGDDDVKKCLSLSQDESKEILAQNICERAANKGDSESQRLFAEILIKQNEHKQALEFLEKSANQKNGEAMYRLAELYRDDEAKARFYYQQSCQNGILKGCEQIHLQDNKVNEELEQARKALEQEKAETKAKLEAERDKLQKEQEAQKAKLEAEREKLEKEKAKSVKAALFFMTKDNAESTYRSVLKTLSENDNNQNQALRTWVENCYARSSSKFSCYHYDQWISILDMRISEANNEEIDPYFGDARVRNRALRNIPELQQMTTVEFNRLVADTREKLELYDDLFFSMWEKEDKKRNTSTSSVITTEVDTSKLTFNEGLAKYEQNGLWGFVDRQGNIVIRPQFRAVGGFYHGRAVVQVANKNWGYIDKQGNWIVNPQFCMAGRFSEGLAGVYVGGWRDTNDDCYGGKWGFITPSGKMAISPVFERAWGFSKVNGVAKAKVIYNGYTGYIDGKGEWVK